jgi:hypothetical protein
MTSRLLPKKTRKALCTWIFAKASSTEPDQTRASAASLRSVFGDGDTIGRGPVSGRANKASQSTKV